MPLSGLCKGPMPDWPGQEQVSTLSVVALNTIREPLLNLSLTRPDPPSTIPPVLLVGLTGGIGSGKSTVAGLLAARGAWIVDADAVAREVVEPGKPALAQLVERFGPEILDTAGRLDRPALGRIAFASEQSRKDLEGITHPAINQEFMRRVGEAPPGAIVVCDVPLLVESTTAGSRGYHVVLVVEAPRTVRLARLEERGVPREDAEARMAAQASDDERRAVATHVIDNSGDRPALEQQLEVIWADLVHRAAEHTEVSEARRRVNARGAGILRRSERARRLGAAIRARLRLRARGRSTGGD